MKTTSLLEIVPDKKAPRWRDALMKRTRLTREATVHRRSILAKKVISIRGRWNVSMVKPPIGYSEVNIAHAASFQFLLTSLTANNTVRDVGTFVSIEVCLKYYRIPDHQRLIYTAYMLKKR